MPAKVTIVPPVQPTVTLEVSARQAQYIHYLVARTHPAAEGFRRLSDYDESADLYRTLNIALRDAGLIAETGALVKPEDYV